MNLAGPSSFQCQTRDSMRMISETYSLGTGNHRIGTQVAIDIVNDAVRVFWVFFVYECEQFTAPRKREECERVRIRREYKQGA